jgi:membrane-associated phospholipid phosphatase
MMEARSTLWSRRELRGVLAGGLTTLVLVFVALTVYVSKRPGPPRLVEHFDQRVRAYPGASRYALAEWFRAGGSAPAVAAAAVLAALLVGLVWRRRDLALLCIVAPLVAGVTELAIRGVVERGMTHSDELAGAFGAGFPSGHAAGITAVAAAVVISVLEVSRNARAHLVVCGAAVALVAVVAAGSVIGGAHRSLDVVGGVMLGIAATFVVFIAVSIQRDVGSRSARSAQSRPQ